VVCEVNSNAHIMNLKNATGIDVSDNILEYIIELLK
jgi:glutathione synthase/RimK-type ligase-like ATP-grasp enzyme